MIVRSTSIRRCSSSTFFEERTCVPPFGFCGERLPPSACRPRSQHECSSCRLRGRRGCRVGHPALAVVESRGCRADSGHGGAVPGLLRWLCVVRHDVLGFFAVCVCALCVNRPGSFRIRPPRRRVFARILLCSCAASARVFARILLCFSRRLCMRAFLPLPPPPSLLLEPLTPVPVVQKSRGETIAAERAAALAALNTDAAAAPKEQPLK